VGALLAEGVLSSVYTLLEYQGAPVNRALVLKRIKAEYVNHALVREQLTTIRERLRGFSHPNVCEILDVYIGETELWIVEQRVDGQSLAAYLEEHGRLSLAAAQLIWQQVARGVQALHEHGMMHGDLKPGHILISRSGDSLKVKLIDVGLGRPLSEHLVGTPSYLAPELVRAASPRPTVRSDLFGLGGTIYEMLFRQRAFPAYTLPERLRNLSADPGRHFLTGEDQPKTAAVSKALFSALEESPERRPRTVTEFVARLDAACSAVPAAAASSHIASGSHVAQAPLVRPEASMRRPIPSLQLSSDLPLPQAESGQFTPPDPRIHQTPSSQRIARNSHRFLIATLVGLLGVVAIGSLVHSSTPSVDEPMSRTPLVESDLATTLPPDLSEAEEELDGGTPNFVDLASPDLRTPQPQPKRRVSCGLRGTTGVAKEDLAAIKECCRHLPGPQHGPLRVLMKQFLRNLVPREFPQDLPGSHSQFFACAKGVELKGALPAKGVIYVCE
jgi:serine/threonine protein kinase